MSGRVWIGTSGWVYKHWLNIFYPRKMSGTDALAFYAERYSTVEINYSYYQLPSLAAFESWRETTPDGFLFAVKASRYLTHMKKLKDPEEPMRLLMERAAGLGPKLGPILFQFPAAWRANPERLAAFIEVLRTYEGHRFAFEFRHQTWLTLPIYELLESIGAALCLPVSPTTPIDVRLTTNWTYIRFHSGEHGTAIGDDALRVWARRLTEWRNSGIDAYVYFNNDPNGHAIHDANTLRTYLAVP